MAGRATLDRTADGCPHTRRGFVIKKKRAAQGRRSGNHHGRHRILKYFRERQAGSPEASVVFAFYSPSRILLFAGLFVKRVGYRRWKANSRWPFVRSRLLSPPPSV